MTVRRGWTRSAQAWWVAAVVLAAAGTVSAQPDPVQGVVFDLFQAGDVGDFTFESVCEGSRFTADANARSFTFEEEGATPTTARTTFACGQARWRVDVPAGTDHLHVRFDGDRRVSGAISPPSFLQEVWIEDANGAKLARFPYFQEGEDSRARTPHDSLTYTVAGSPVLHIVWVFQEQAETTLGIDLSPDVAATVWMPRVEFSGVPVAGATSSSDIRRTGTVVVDEVRIRAPVDAATLEAYEVVIRVAAHPELAFHEVILPSGGRVAEATTRNDTTPHDHNGVLVEQSHDRMQVYVAAGLTAAHGPGTYDVTLRAVSDVRAVAALVPVAMVLILLPVPFAVAAVLGVATFEREAFGGFRRSAHTLRLAVFAAILYYVLVVASAFIGGRLALMASWPMGAEGALLYVQVGAAIAAFLLLWLVARELARITRPRRGEE